MYEDFHLCTAKLVYISSIYILISAMYILGYVR